MDQQTFLRRARRELGVPYRRLAAELGVSERTIEKWAMKGSSADHRAMPLMAIRLLLRMLDDHKQALIARGERSAAETIDAIAAQVDPARLAASLRSFDALQRSARRMAPVASRSRKPRSFATLAQKNAWERKEETRLARRAQTPAPGKR